MVIQGYKRCSVAYHPYNPLTLQASGETSNSANNDDDGADNDEGGRRQL